MFRINVNCTNIEKFFNKNKINVLNNVIAVVFFFMYVTYVTLLLKILIRYSLFIKFEVVTNGYHTLLFIANILEIVYQTISSMLNILVTTKMAT